MGAESNGSLFIQDSRAAERLMKSLVRGFFCVMKCTQKRGSISFAIGGYGSWQQQALDIGSY
jgi:hypothetical protein